MPPNPGNKTTLLRPDGVECSLPGSYDKKQEENEIISHPDHTILGSMSFSCAGSGQEEPDVPTQPEEPKGVSISFGGNSGTWQDAPTTRANEETGLETISKTFKVWGYKTTGGNYTSGFNQSQNVMDAYTVNWTQQTANTTSSNTADWEYVGIANQTIKYWDYSATSYRFFAYSIPTAAGNSSVPYFQEPTSIKGSTANMHPSLSHSLTIRMPPQLPPLISPTSGCQTTRTSKTENTGHA